MPEKSKQLFIVRVSKEVVVLAKDWCDAELEASQLNSWEILDEAEYESSEICNWSHLPNLWHDSIPYGSEDDKTCGEILSELLEQKAKQKHREEMDKLQRKFPFMEGEQ